MKEKEAMEQKLNKAIFEKVEKPKKETKSKPKKIIAKLNPFQQNIKDINFAKQTLDKDHYGLDKIKERILEHLAVRNLKVSRSKKNESCKFIFFVIILLSLHNTKFLQCGHLISPKVL